MTSKSTAPTGSISRRNALRGLATSLIGGAVSHTALQAQDAPSGMDGSMPDEGERQGVTYSAAEGTWGRIRYYHFYLEAPEALLEHIPPPSTQTRWIVPQTESPHLESMFTEAGLDETTRKAILDPRRLAIYNGIFAMFPDHVVVRNLPREARARIYRYLAQFPQNAHQSFPVYILSGSVDEWAEDTEIRPELIQIMRDCSYRRGDVLVFSDIPLVLSSAHSESEARQLIKKFTRVRTTIARLEVDRDTDSSKLIDYWSTGLGLRRKDVEPLLRAVVKTEGVDELDVLHLLPPLPRKLLYTYPDIDLAMDGRFPDCHWTSLNFFNYTAQSFFLNEKLATTAILERFDKVEPPYHFGDILMFMTENKEAVHSCTYIAADLVFTKNGRNIVIPWTLAHLKDIENLYAEADGRPMRITAYRARPAA